MAIRDKTIGALINYYNDADMLRHQWETGQFDHYDRICIYDGPYSYAKALSLSAEVVMQPLRDTELGKIILADPRVTYCYQIWEDEAVKRIAAFEALTTDIIALHDTDEFLDFDYGLIEQFIDSPASVASFYCQNLCLDGVMFSQPFYAVEEIDQLPHKNFMFKRDQVSAADHLNHLWLVGVKQVEPDRSSNFHPPLALGYHFTSMRSKQGQTQKFIFYSALYQHTQGNGDSALERLRKLVTDDAIPSAEGLAIYLSANPDYFGVPGPGHDVVYKARIRGSAYLEDILERVAREVNMREAGPLLLLAGHGCCVYAPAGRPALSLVVPGATLHVKSNDYRLDHPAGAETDLGEHAGQLRLEPPAGEGALGRLYTIHAGASDHRDLIAADLVEG